MTLDEQIKQTVKSLSSEKIPLTVFEILSDGDEIYYRFVVYAKKAGVCRIGIKFIGFNPCLPTDKYFQEILDSLNNKVKEQLLFQLEEIMSKYKDVEYMIEKMIGEALKSNQKRLSFTTKAVGGVNITIAPGKVKINKNTYLIVNDVMQRLENLSIEEKELIEDKLKGLLNVETTEDK